MSINIPSLIAPYKRIAWKPLVTDQDGSLVASKFSGIPWLKETEDWPQCRNCSNPMQFFLQLNLNELPEKLQGEFGQGLLQLFYCTGQEPLCEVDCEAFFPFAKSVLARVVQPDEGNHSFAIPAIEDLFPPKLIIGWEEVDDYPNAEEAESLGINLDDSEWEVMHEIGFPRSGDKLAGWPYWIQGVEYPNCPVCDEQMRLLFQIDSNDNLPYSFGDVGCGHITQCETHKDQVAFGWACT